VPFGYVLLARRSGRWQSLETPQQFCECFWEASLRCRQQHGRKYWYV